MYGVRNMWFESRNKHNNVGDSMKNVWATILVATRATRLATPRHIYQCCFTTKIWFFSSSPFIFNNPWLEYANSICFRRFDLRNQEIRFALLIFLANFFFLLPGSTMLSSTHVGDRLKRLNHWNRNLLTQKA